MHCRRAIAAVILSAASTALLAEGVPAQSTFRTQSERVDASAFPRITLHFQIVDAAGQPVRTLPDEEFIILEDGREVHRFRPNVLRQGALSTVLALDTSGSMERGSGGGNAKIEAAKEAATRFFGKLEAQTPCGLVLFHHEPYFREPPTLDRDRLRGFVASAKPRGGTACYDAAYEAVRMLDAASTNGQRAVVVMTDGRDVNSKHVLADVIAEARRTRTRVYTIGLGEPGRNEPVRTILVLDRSLSMQGAKFANMQRAAIRFIALLPPEAADVAILPFDHDVDVVDGFATNKARLQDEVRQLRPRGETSLYDAMAEALEALNAAEPPESSKRRRSLVVLTDGADTNSRRQARDVIERAKADGVKIYVLGLGEPGEIDEPGMRSVAQGSGGDYFHVRDPEQLTEVFEMLSIQLHDDGIDEHSLRRLALETGGEYYPVHDADRLSFMFERVAAEMESTFSVSFDSRRKRHDGTARGLEIRFGELAVGRAGYVTHGLITPMSDHGLYLGTLLLMLFFIVLPGCVRWLGRGLAPRGQ